MIDWTAVLIVTGLCVVMPIWIVALVYRSRDHEINRKTDVLLKAVENGQEIDPSVFADTRSSRTLKMKLLNKMTWGTVLSVIGVGMLAGSPFIGDSTDAIITGAVVAAVGAGLLLAFFVGRKWMMPEIEAEEAAARMKRQKTEEKQ